MTTRAKSLRKAGAVLALGTALLLGNVGAAVGASYTVRATKDDTWRPKTKEILKNDKIVWRNPHEDAHNVVAYGGNWSFREEIEPGDPASKRFRRTGTFKYYCDYHASVDNGVCAGTMCGKIRVLRPPG